MITITTTLSFVQPFDRDDTNVAHGQNGLFILYFPAKEELIDGGR